MPVQTEGGLIGVWCPQSDSAAATPQADLEMTVSHSLVSPTTSVLLQKQQRIRSPEREVYLFTSASLWDFRSHFVSLSIHFVSSEMEIMTYSLTSL